MVIRELGNLPTQGRSKAGVSSVGKVGAKVKVGAGKVETRPEQAGLNQKAPRSGKNTRQGRGKVGTEWTILLWPCSGLVPTLPGPCFLPGLAQRPCSGLASVDYLVATGFAKLKITTVYWYLIYYDKSNDSIGKF